MEVYLNNKSIDISIASFKKYKSCHVVTIGKWSWVYDTIINKLYKFKYQDMLNDGSLCV